MRIVDTQPLILVTSGGEMMGRTERYTLDMWKRNRWISHDYVFVFHAGMYVMHN